jgi:amidase
VDELAFLPATEQARLVRERQVSPVELVELYLERIERLDPELGSFVTVCAEAALADARAKADEPGEGPFHGVPIALKDLDTTAGIRTTFSCPAFAEHVPDFDLAHVARTRAAGFVVLGKTNTPEFGTTAFTDSPLNGPCRTPWDLGRNAGGSSGGAGAAVAAGLVGIAHALGLEVTAEGLETHEQLAFLREQGCRYAQGYLLAKPTPAEELQDLLDAAPWESELDL